MSDKSRDLERRDYDPSDPSKQHEPIKAQDLVSSYIEKNLSSGLSLTAKAYKYWCEIAGKRAIKHTMAVWVNEKNNKEYPTLYVYLDNNSLRTDFTTNEEIYRDRLAYVGLTVSDIQFLLSKKVAVKEQENKTRSYVEELPQLTQQEETEIRELCKNLPEALKANAFKAIKISYQQAKLKNTKNNKTTS